MKNKRTIVKYYTGNTIPDNATYLGSAVERHPGIVPYTAHYFLLHQEILPRKIKSSKAIKPIKK